MTDRLEHRIQRSEFGMANARDKNWRWAWYRAFVIAVNEKNAQVAARAVRHPGVTRDVKPGLRQEGQCPVVATSGKQSMSSFLDTQVGPSSEA